MVASCTSLSNSPEAPYISEDLYEQTAIRRNATISVMPHAVRLYARIVITEERTEPQG